VGTAELAELEYRVGRVLVHPLRTTNASQSLAGLISVATSCGLRVPGEVAAVARAFVTAEGVLSQLVPSFDLIGSSTRAVRELAGGVAVRAGTEAAASPVVAGVALADKLDRGLAKVTAAFGSAPAGAPAPQETTPDPSFARRAIETALASITGLMGVLLLMAPAGPPVASLGLHHLLGYYLLTVSGILGLRVLVQVFRHGPVP
jgi:predicted unusual protein kinase regulating ubiquinone biosynthesis (AarF/ABC1/UbiB family)